MSLTQPNPTSASVGGTEPVPQASVWPEVGGNPKPTRGCRSQEQRRRCSLLRRTCSCSLAPTAAGTLCLGHSGASSQSPARPSVLTFSPLRASSPFSPESPGSPGLREDEAALASHHPVPTRGPISHSPTSSWASELPVETPPQGRAQFALNPTCKGGCGTGQRTRTLWTPRDGGRDTVILTQLLEGSAVSELKRLLT